MGCVVDANPSCKRVSFLAAAKRASTCAPIDVDSPVPTSASRAQTSVMRSSCEPCAKGHSELLRGHARWRHFRQREVFLRSGKCSSSCSPCANAHIAPLMHQPLSKKVHNSVLRNCALKTVSFRRPPSLLLRPVSAVEVADTRSAGPRGDSEEPPETEAITLLGLSMPVEFCTCGSDCKVASNICLGVMAARFAEQDRAGDWGGD
mmetsp:Transcript_13774/g.44581  ORF Transcript_13774/g.44581 Transcript_13774/m.44581 type:complete len:205 (-) Transcript_13774:28-642(-)